MELFDNHFVFFGQVLLVSSLKTLVIPIKLPFLHVVKLQPYLDYFQNTYSKMKTNIRL